MIPVDIVTEFINDKMVLPSYAKMNDSGMDVQANVTGKVPIVFGHTMMIPTGIFVGLPEGGLTFNWEIQVRPRSGLAAKYGITVLNSPGTIDQGYRNEIKILVHNTRKDVFIINPGDRIAQIVLAKAYHIQWNEVDDLSDTDRGQGGFGHTGV